VVRLVHRFSIHEPCHCGQACSRLDRRYDPWNPSKIFTWWLQLAAARQVQLRDGLAVEGRKGLSLETVADVTAWARLDAMPVTCNCVLGDCDVVFSLQYTIKVCPAAMQNRSLTCEGGEPFSPGQAMRCRCCAGVRAVCHDFSVELDGHAYDEKSGQPSTREPSDAYL
jgi:hypothetical protein